MIFKIALLQTAVSADKKKNLEKAASLIKKAKESGADLAVLPEMFLCPYETVNFPLYAEEEGGDSYRFLSSLSKEYGIWLCAGSVPERDAEGRIYNTSYVFDREGQKAAKHRKMHLFDIDVEGGQHFHESDTLTAGNAVTIFDTEFGKMGLCICYDFRFPELARLMALKGARVILVPAAFNMTTGPAHWEILFRTRAMENSLYAIGVAPARDMDASYHSYANSLVSDPWGDVIARLGTEEEVRIISLNSERIEEVRQQLPMLVQRRNDIYTLSER